MKKQFSLQQLVVGVVVGVVLLLVGTVIVYTFVTSWLPDILLILEGLVSLATPDGHKKALEIILVLVSSVVVLVVVILGINLVFVIPTFIWKQIKKLTRRLRRR